MKPPSTHLQLYLLSGREKEITEAWHWISNTGARKRSKYRLQQQNMKPPSAHIRLYLHSEWETEIRVACYWISNTVTGRRHYIRLQQHVKPPSTHRRMYLHADRDRDYGGIWISYTVMRDRADIIFNNTWSHHLHVDACTHKLKEKQISTAGYWISNTIRATG